MSYTCEVCRTELDTLVELSAHTATHANQARFVCIECHCHFMTQASLDIHCVLHSHKKRYYCTQCYSSFNTRQHLRDHVQTHSVIQPHICSICSWDFAQPGGLKKHMKTHDMSRPYRCDLCQLGFTRELNYTTHMKQKHKSSTHVSVQSQIEPVGIVTTTSLQTVTAGGNSTTVSTIVSSEGSAYLVTSYTNASTTTMVPLPTGGMATATTDKSALLAGRDTDVSNGVTSLWDLPVIDVSEEDFY